MKVLFPQKQILPLAFAEGVGFEPTGPLRVAVFETVPIGHSGTLPISRIVAGKSKKREFVA